MKGGGLVFLSCVTLMTLEKLMTARGMLKRRYQANP